MRFRQFTGSKVSITISHWCLTAADKLPSLSSQKKISEASNPMRRGVVAASHSATLSSMNGLGFRYVHRSEQVLRTHRPREG